MAILIDFNQLVIATVSSVMASDKNLALDESLVRHCVLGSIRNIRTKLKGQFGDKLVLACDSKKSWRKEMFPYYKATRKADRDKNTTIDWALLYKYMDTIRAELIEYFPYYTLQVEGAEGDDIIAVLAKRFTEEQEMSVIASGDKDFKQLHTPFVQQYDFVKSRWLKEPYPEQYLNEHILTGDRIDGVPNVLSGDDCFVMKRRQNKMTAKRLEELKLFGMYGDSLPLVKKYPEIPRNFQRNTKLIDLSQQPQRIKDAITAAYEEPRKARDGNRLLTYFIKHRLQNLTQSLGDY